MTRRDFDGKINVVTTVDQTVANSIADAMAPGAEKLMCSTRQEMMAADYYGCDNGASQCKKKRDVYKRQVYCG